MFGPIVCLSYYAGRHHAPLQIWWARLWWCKICLDAS